MTKSARRRRRHKCRFVNSQQIPFHPVWHFALLSRKSSSPVPRANFTPAALHQGARTNISSPERGCRLIKIKWRSLVPFCIVGRGATEPGPDYALFITHTEYEPPPAIVVRREKREDSIFSTVSLPAIAQCQCATAASDAMASVCDPFVVLCLISNILGDQNALFVSPQKRRRCITHITTPSLSHTSAVQLQPVG